MCEVTATDEVETQELIGSSERSWEDAVATALREAVRTLERVVEIEVLNYKAVIKENKIDRYIAHVKVSFIVKRVGLEIGTPPHPHQQ